ncbi:MAG TPA: transcription antitermination factor NusB [Piscirickettsiaceae bacterium]|nr:transcription antitermination factor NusB [Piscirickettsiaceae bacterium]HIQ40955.1 transcription antitermination factor NusB [Sulfurivirga caldicuralii]
MKVNPALSHRTLARQLLIQALYQHELAGTPRTQLEQEFAARPEWPKIDQGLFRTALGYILAHRDELDAVYQPYLDRAFSLIDPVERGILRLGVYELTQTPAVPYKTVIDEAVELAKDFGAEESYKYVNAVLDKVSRAVRQIERSAG